ncbi:uncharacterized protein [Anas acuta]|uniref:uncharacterized protein n=1 Tax=Anas acuta TaxID=28680 RepID=UPI0035C882EE
MIPLGALVPARFLTLMSHLVGLGTVAGARDTHVRASLPLEFSEEEYALVNTELLCALGLAVVLLAIEFGGFFTGVSMISTRHGALCRRSVHTQTDCPLKNAAVQVTACRECQSLLLPSAGSRDTGCVRCEQVDDLIRMVAELKEEVERLRAIRECEREIDFWSNSLQGLKERYQGETPQMGVDPLPCRRRAEGGDLGVEEEWRQVPA